MPPSMNAEPVTATAAATTGSLNGTTMTSAPQTLRIDVPPTLVNVGVERLTPKKKWMRMWNAKMQEKQLVPEENNTEQRQECQVDAGGGAPAPMATDEVEQHSPQGRTENAEPRPLVPDKCITTITADEVAPGRGEEEEQDGVRAEKTGGGGSEHAPVTADEGEEEINSAVAPPQEEDARGDAQSTTSPTSDLLASDVRPVLAAVESSLTPTISPSAKMKDPTAARSLPTSPVVDEKAPSGTVDTANTIIAVAAEEEEAMTESSSQHPETFTTTSPRNDSGRPTTPRSGSKRRPESLDGPQEEPLVVPILELTASEVQRLERRKKRKTNWDARDVPPMPPHVKAAVASRPVPPHVSAPLSSQYPVPPPPPPYAQRFPRGRPLWRHSQSMGSIKDYRFYPPPPRPLYHSQRPLSADHRLPMHARSSMAPPHSPAFRQPPPRRPFYHSNSMPPERSRSVGRDYRSPHTPQGGNYYR